MPVFMLLMVGFFTVNILLWLIRMGLSYGYMRKTEEAEVPENIRIVIIIPVLNEEKRIRKTIKMCSCIVQENVEVVFATSSKERIKKGNTIEIIEQYKKKYPWINSYTYNGDGYMAHQLNYAIQAYCRENRVDRHTVFAVYNIDSVITRQVLQWVAAQYQINGERSLIYQQYGCYYKNWKDCEGLFLMQKAILWSNMLWQTRWSIGFEMAHAWEGMLFCKRNIWFMNYCIGHGLFFNMDVYKKIGGFEEMSLNEDAIFGLQACLNNIKIIPVPWLELADSPDSVFSLFKQKITWIYGPGQAFEYRKFIKEREKTRKRDGRGFRLTLLCIQLFEHALRWLLVPVIVIVAIIGSFLYSAFYGMIMLCLILFYLSGINFIAVHLYDSNKYLSLKEALAVILGCIPQFILHGISGWCGVIQLLGRWLFGKTIIKRKTEMRV